MNRTEQIKFLERTVDQLFYYSPVTPDNFDSLEDFADHLIQEWHHPNWVTVEDMNLVRRTLINKAKGW